MESIRGTRRFTVGNIRTRLKRGALGSVAAAAALLTPAAAALGQAHMTSYRVVAASGTAQAHVTASGFTGSSLETWHLARGTGSQPNIAHYGTLGGRSYLGDAHFAIAGTLAASASAEGRNCQITSHTGQDVYDGHEPSDVQLALADRPAARVSLPWRGLSCRRLQSTRRATIRPASAPVSWILRRRLRMT